MPAFDFNAWRDAGRPIPFCTKEPKHVRLDLDSTRPIGLACAECKADCEFEKKASQDETKKVFVEPV